MKKLNRLATLVIILGLFALSYQKKPGFIAGTDSNPDALAKPTPPPPLVW